MGQHCCGVTNMTCHQHNACKRHRPTALSEYSCYRSCLYVAWVQHHSYSAALQNKVVCKSHASQLRHHGAQRPAARQKFCVQAQCNGAVLTNEMGGRFFLNFALTAPMLPCALVTCRSHQQEISVLAYMSCRSHHSWHQTFQ